MHNVAYSPELSAKYFVVILQQQSEEKLVDKYRVKVNNKNIRTSFMDVKVHAHFI